MVRSILLIAVFSLAASQGGCVRRTILVTSEPNGALVYLNDQEVGRTPVEVDFTYYGEYDVRLVRDGYEPITTSAMAWPPLWDNIPFDLVAEAIPGEPHAQIHWHYDLQPPDDNRDEMLTRAMALREKIELPPSETTQEEVATDVPAAEGDSNETPGAEPPPAVRESLPTDIDVVMVWERVHERLREVGYDGLTRAEQSFISVWELEQQVSTGGFRQYFHNSTGDRAYDVVRSLEAIGAEETAAIATRALSVLGSGAPSRSSESRRAVMAPWPEDGPEFARLAELDEEFWATPDNLREMLKRYVERNRAEFQ